MAAEGGAWNIPLRADRDWFGTLPFAELPLRGTIGVAWPASVG